jgi:hypothetical protein
MGGDEFTILLDDVTDPSGAMRVAKCILSQGSEPFLVESRVPLKQPISSPAPIARRNHSPVFRSAAETVKHSPCRQRNFTDGLFPVTFVG